MHQHEKLNYVEFGTTNISATKQFFEQAFGWSFVDYGPEYSAFTDQGLDGGFYVAEQVSQTTTNGAALLVFYSSDIRATLAKVEQFGGKSSARSLNSPEVVVSISPNQVATSSRSGLRVINL